MKLTTTQLRRIIKEEVQKTLSEARPVAPRGGAAKAKAPAAASERALMKLIGKLKSSYYNDYLEGDLDVETLADGLDIDNMSPAAAAKAAGIMPADVPLLTSIVDMWNELSVGADPDEAGVGKLIYDEFTYG